MRLPLLALSILLLPVCLSAQSSSLFPERGPAAIHQRALDLQHPAVLLCVIPRPGDEDLPLMAYARLGLGAQVVAVFVTNGEAEQSAISGSIPIVAAGERKEEAFNACAHLGAETYFLNMADAGVVADTAHLRNFWSQDTLMSRLAYAIRTYKPDLIVQVKDVRNPHAASPLDILVSKAIENASVNAAGWEVFRILTGVPDTAGGPEGRYAQKHPVWKKRYTDLARETARLYASRAASRCAETPHTYVSPILPIRSVSPDSLLLRLPQIPRSLRGVESAVKRSISRLRDGRLQAKIGPVSAAIDSANARLRHMGSQLSGIELRLLTTWKNRLEDLRCSLLDINVVTAQSDTMIGEKQLFFMTVQKASGKTSFKGAKIVFPLAADKTWWVNESRGYEFDVTAPQEFKILSPAPLGKNAPASLFGVMSPTMRLRFPFIIYRVDSLDRTRNFAYRGDILLRIGPRRSVEIRTPLIRAIDGEYIVPVLQNFSRDPFEGKIFLRDSSIVPQEVFVRLGPKDSVWTDTLRVRFRTGAPEGDVTLHLELSKRGGIFPVAARSFSTVVDSSRRVGLVSLQAESRLASGLRRLPISFAKVTRTSITPSFLNSLDVLIIDQNAAVLRTDLSLHRREIEMWVQAGGHLVILPQECAADLPGPTPAEFLPSIKIPPEQPVNVDSSHMLLRSPNVLRGEDWDGWIVSRAWMGLRLKAAESGAADMPVSADSVPLIVTTRSGKGRVTCIALDLESQLVNIHPGAFRLLANILALR